MSSYILTDGLTMLKEQNNVFKYIEEENSVLFVNGYKFCTKNAKNICHCIDSKKPISLLEIGFVFGELKFKIETASYYTNEEKYKLYFVLYSDIEKDVLEFYNANNYPFEIEFVKLKNKNKADRTVLENVLVDKVEESISEKEPNTKQQSVFRTFEEKTTVLPKRKMAKSETEGALKQDDVVLPYPETLEELANFPIKNGSRMTVDGQIAILNLRDFGSKKISEVLDMPQSTISSLFFRFDKDDLSFSKEELDILVKKRNENIKTTNQSCQSDKKQEIQTKQDNQEKSKTREKTNDEPFNVPALMSNQMNYDPFMDGMDRIFISGKPLTGNIIHDAEIALGYELSEKDRSVLTNAFFCLTVYEEDFLKNLRFGQFSHMEDAPLLKPVCEAYHKIRKANALKRSVN